MQIIWEGITINVNYVENYSRAFEKTYADKLSHIEIRADEELPITETGYKSIFIHHSNLMRWGGVEKFIIEELDNGAKSDAWKFKQESKKQLCLF